MTRWIRAGEMAFLFMQRTQVQLLALMSGNSQSPVILAPRDQTMYVYTQKHIHTYM